MATLLRRPVRWLDLPSSGSGEPTTAAGRDRGAFFDATGVRLFRMPMTPGLVRAALAA